MKHILRGIGLAVLVVGMAAVATADVQPPLTNGVPEINPGMIASAMTLLTGGMLVLFGRQK